MKNILNNWLKDNGIDINKVYQEKDGTIIFNEFGEFKKFVDKLDDDNFKEFTMIAIK